jgi:transcription antitermination protein NusB
MPARAKARRRALDILYESELRGQSPLATLAERREAAEPPVSPYTARLVEGVHEHADRLSEVLSAHAKGWTLDRMAPVDRNILRIGAYELLYADDVPDIVAITEAVRLARDLSGEEAPAFVNGLLARLMELKPTLRS